jgi:bacterial/archaeal transporter family-2 protein
VGNAFLPIALAVTAGVLIAAQAPTNALLSRAAGSPLTAAMISFLVGSAALALLLLVMVPARPDGSALRSLPAWAWAGGLYGAFAVAVAAFGAPRIGVGTLLVAIIAGQLIASAALDHFGALGLERHPLSFTRTAGIALVLLGAVLVRRG